MCLFRSAADILLSLVRRLAALAPGLTNGLIAVVTAAVLAAPASAVPAPARPVAVTAERTTATTLRQAPALPSQLLAPTPADRVNAGAALVRQQVNVITRRATDIRRSVNAATASVGACASHLTVACIR